jgi:FMN-dependent NADH-azoreductase
MKNILLVHSSPRGSESYSQRVADSIVKEIKDRHRRTTVTFRDLAQDPLPYLRAVLGFIGLTDIDVVRIEGVAISTIGAEKAAATATAHSLEILACAA